MIQITKNFGSHELAQRYKWEEVPAAEKARLIKLSREILQPARDKLGSPILISSGYRSKAHNIAVGGASDSRHVYGDAVDIYAPALSGEAFFEFMLKNFSDKIGGAGLYFNENIPGKFIHIDQRPKVNNRVVTWYFNGSAYTRLKSEHQKVLNNLKIAFI